MAAKVESELIEVLCRAWGDNLDLWNRWQFYRGAAGDYRWRVVAEENGKIIGASTQGYRRRDDCVKNAKRMGFGGKLPGGVSG